MNRKEIRKYARGLIDEFSEEPEGLIRDESDEASLNMLINVAIQNVQLELIPHIPEYFRKTFLISVEANKRTYDIVSDLKVTDFLKMADILHNETGKKPQGLIYAEPDELHEYEIKVGEVGEPFVWSYESRTVLAFDPTPAATIANRYKGLYYAELPGLNQDEEHDPEDDKYAIPDLPKSAHILVAIDATRQCHLIGEEEMADLDKRYDFYLNIAKNNLLSLKPSFSSRERLPLIDSVR